MKSFTKKCSSSKRGLLLHLFTFIIVLTMLIGSLPVSAASGEIVVKTKKQLVKAMKNKSAATIIFRTDRKTNFIIPTIENSANKKLVMEAPNARAFNKATFKTITLNKSEYFNERGNDNSLYIKGDGVKLTVSKGIEAKKVSITATDVIVKVASDANVGDIICNKKAAEITVAVEKNAEANITIKKQADLVVQGDKTADIKIVPKAPNTKITTSAPIDIVVEKDVDLQLEKGAEDSAVTLKNKDAGVKLENNTDKKVTVTDSDGKKQTVKKGEDFTSDNYVGKPEETDDGTEGETSGTPSDGTETDKKEDEDKEEEKKDDTTSTSIGGSVGGGSQGGESYNPYIPPRAVWGTPIYVWNNDNTKLTATLPCTNKVENDIVEMVDVTITGTTAPTCTEKGSIVYTSEEFKNSSFTKQSKTVDIGVLGHDWGEVTYTWSEDNTQVTATRRCSRNQSHSESEKADAAVAETIDPTCTEKGSIVYTSIDFENAAFTKQTKTIEIDAVGHNWGDVTYTWSENKKYVTVERICANDNSHTETETVEVISETTKQPKCGETGEITYTASFTNAEFGTWSEKETLPALDHDYSLAEESIPKPIFKESLDEGGYLECTGWEKGVNTYVCANDSNHNYTEEVKVPMEIIAEELGDGICEIDGSNITIDLGEKLEQYNENNGTHASWTEAFGGQTIGQYINSLIVYPYNDELKQWWIIPEGLEGEEYNKLVSIQSALYAFIGDGIGEFVFENEEDAVTVIDDILYTGETVTYNVKFVPKDADTFETLEITATFILPVMELDIIG